MKIKLVSYGSADYQMALELRYKILRKPIGLDFTEEFLEQDKEQFHFVAKQEGRVIGSLTLQKIDDFILKMRQVAVDDSSQNKGIGSKLVVFAEKFAVENGYDTIILHARKSALYFYLKLGYSIISDEFIEVGLPHLKMSKKLL